MTDGDRRWLVLVTTRSGDNRLLHNVPGQQLQYADLRLGKGERAFVAPMDEVTTFTLEGIEVKPTLTKQYMRAAEQRRNSRPVSGALLILLLVVASVLMGLGIASVVGMVFG